MDQKEIKVKIIMSGGAYTCGAPKPAGVYGDTELGAIGYESTKMHIHEVQTVRRCQEHRGNLSFKENGN